MGGGQTCQEVKFRINSELKDIQNNPPNNWTVIPNSQNWNQWRIEIVSDPTCPFHSIPFYLKVEFQNDYPKSKPKLVLQRPELFYHPNIFTNGVMCQIHLLNRVTQDMRIRDRIEAFLYVLYNPNPDSPANSEAGRQCKKDFRAYYRKANRIFRGQLKI